MHLFLFFIIVMTFGLHAMQPDENPEARLWDLCSAQDCAGVKDLLALYDERTRSILVNTPDIFGEAAIFKAIKHDNAAIVCCLLFEGADIEVTNMHFQTPLDTIIARNKKSAMADILIRAGAAATEENILKINNSCLYPASVKSAADIENMLIYIASRGNVTLMDKLFENYLTKGLLPFQALDEALRVASRAGHVDMVSYLSKIITQEYEIRVWYKLFSTIIVQLQVIIQRREINDHRRNYFKSIRKDLEKILYSYKSMYEAHEVFDTTWSFDEPCSLENKVLAGAAKLFM